MLGLRLLATAVLASTVLAQFSTSSSASTTASSNSSTSASVATTATGTVISASSTSTSTSLGPSPTANVTNGADQDLVLWVPETLRMCDRVQFAFTAPALAKSCAIYVTNTNVYLQQILLGGEYTSMTSGTFSWLIDVPAGLSINVQFWVTINGQTRQYTQHDIVIQDSGDWSCLAHGSGQNTQSIISYASALNDSYTYAPPKATSTSHHSNTGAIAGGVIGALAGLAILILALYFLYRRRKRSLVPPPPEGEKPYEYPEGAVGAYPPPGFPSYAQQVQQQYAMQGPGAVPYSPAPARSPGLAAEPMAVTPPHSPSHPTTATASEFGGRTTRGTEGLADPNMFLSRSTASGSAGMH
ncbi:hypothetical protein JCM10207_005880 [Rhodosporidiobolus poonsookiae]